MEGKGLVTSELGEPLQERGGRARRYFRITQKGLQQAHETRQVLVQLWSEQPQGGAA
jgi:DNA-binding PadR family transcriptional regulator